MNIRRISLIMALAGAAALATPEAQQCGVIHRDLNPLNIMLANNGKPRLMDFGIATLLGKRDDDGIWGTLRYMSPEQCENNNPSTASDIFSLGLILYEMLIGKPFAQADNKFAVINKILNEELSLPDNIDPALQLVLKKALAKDPAARYADALDMQHDLVKHLENIAPNINTSAANDSHGSTLPTIFIAPHGIEKGFPDTLVVRARPPVGPGSWCGARGRSGRGCRKTRNRRGSPARTARPWLHNAESQ